MRQPQKISEASVGDDRIDTLTDLVDRLADSVATLDDRLDSLTRSTAQVLAPLATAVTSMGQCVNTRRLQIIDADGRLVATIGPGSDGSGEIVVYNPTTGCSVAMRTPTPTK